jgi:hypothetical protein
MTSSKNNPEETQQRTEVRQQDFNVLSVARIRSLLKQPDISPSQKRTLLNLLKRLDK